MEDTKSKLIPNYRIDPDYTQQCLELPRNICVVDISARISTQAHTQLDKTTFAAPCLKRESLRHIDTVHKRTGRPNLAVVSPALLNPLDFGMALAELFQHKSRSRGGLAFEETGLQGCQEATADEQESRTIVVALSDEGLFAVCHVVVGVVRSHEGDV
jgi:hypothetical protein